MWINFLIFLNCPREIISSIFKMVYASIEVLRKWIWEIKKRKSSHWNLMMELFYIFHSVNPIFYLAMSVFPKYNQTWGVLEHPDGKRHARQRKEQPSISPRSYSAFKQQEVMKRGMPLASMSNGRENSKIPLSTKKLRIS